MVAIIKHPKIKYAVVYNRRKKSTRKDATAPIFIRAYQAGDHAIYFNTGVEINKQDWNARKCEVKSTHPNFLVYNKTITDLRQELEAYEMSMINLRGGLQVRELRNFRSNAHLSFLSFFAEQLELSDMKRSSWKSYNNTLNKLKAYRKEIYFSDLNHRFVMGFDRFLREQGLDPNTIERQHNRVKTFINKAMRLDILSVDANPYKRFKAKKVEPKRVFLTEEELERIENLEFTEREKAMRYTRDMYLMQCYTGLRYSDLVRITRSHIAKGKKGYTLTITAKKTDKILQLPLYNLFRQGDAEQSRPERIIERYLEQGQSRDKPIFSKTNQYYNRSLKGVAARAKVHKAVTTHTARRTFACILATKVELPVLQRLLQHSRPDMTAIYIKLSNKVIEDELSKATWK